VVVSLFVVHDLHVYMRALHWDLRHDGRDTEDMKLSYQRLLFEYR
jgi:hypothetical protein